MNILNPYRDLPTHQFWRSAVAGIEPFRFDPVTSTRFMIGKDEKVATAGSCFAQHISNRLAKIGFNYFVPEDGAQLVDDQRKRLNYGVFSARFGNLYTTRQLLQLFQECFDGRTAAEATWQTADGRWVDALRPQITPGGYPTEAEVRSARAIHLTAVRRMFTECDIFVFTLGLTESWRSRADGTVYPVAPGVAGGSFDPARHEFVNFNVMEVMADLDEFLQRLKAINSQVKVVLTVSPVPLIATYEPRNVLVSTTYSKSVLRVAAEMAYRQYDWVEYFPSYEIITGNYNNSAYYEADYRGINTIGVDHAMRCFLTHYTDGGLSQKSSGIHYVAPETDVDVICDEEAIDQVRV
jgi:hypothetical protein